LAIKRERKVELLDIYRAQVKKSSALVFTNYRGFSVAKLQSLRVKMGETNTGFMVVKNTLLGLALKEAGLPNPDSLLSGTNAVAFVGEDIGTTVKSLLDWIKVEKMGEVSGALLGNSVLDAKNAIGHDGRAYHNWTLHSPRPAANYLAIKHLVVRLLSSAWETARYYSPARRSMQLVLQVYSPCLPGPNRPSDEFLTSQ